MDKWREKSHRDSRNAWIVLINIFHSRSITISAFICHFDCGSSDIKSQSWSWQIFSDYISNRYIRSFLFLFLIFIFVFFFYIFCVVDMHSKYNVCWGQWKSNFCVARNSNHIAKIVFIHSSCHNFHFILVAIVIQFIFMFDTYFRLLPPVHAHPSLTAKCAIPFHDWFVRSALYQLQKKKEEEKYQQLLVGIGETITTIYYLCRITSYLLYVDIDYIFYFSLANIHRERDTLTHTLFSIMECFKLYHLRFLLLVLLMFLNYVSYSIKSWNFVTICAFWTQKRSFLYS